MWLLPGESYGRGMTNNTITPSHATRGPRVHRRRWWLNLATMAAAVVLWTIAVPVAGVDLTVTINGERQEVTQLAVISGSLLAGGAAWGSLTLLESLTVRARAIWTWLASVVLVVSLTGPLAATNAAATGVLVLLHLVVGPPSSWACPPSAGLARARPRRDGPQGTEELSGIRHIESLKNLCLRCIQG